MTVYENHRQCGGAGSSSSSCCGVFPGTEASRRSGPTCRRQSLQREALEAGLAGGWFGSFGRQAASWSNPQVVREPATIAGRDFEKGSAAVGIPNRFVDDSACGGGGPQEVPREVPSGPRGTDTARLGLHAAEAATSGTRTRCGGRRAVAQTGLAPHQKKARRRAASIVFIDETGFRLQPVNRRTWAPRGETPVQRAWDRYDRLSVIGAVTLSPLRRKISTPFQIHQSNIRSGEVLDFIRQLRRHFRRPLIICLDRWAAHRSAIKKLAASRFKNIDVEWLPAYAPELNPVEPRWSHTKRGDLANFVPHDSRHLARAVRTSLNGQSVEQLKRSFFHSAQLKI